MRRIKVELLVFLIAVVFLGVYCFLKMREEEKMVIPTKTVVSADTKEFLADRTDSGKKVAVVRVHLNPVSK